MRKFLGSIVAIIVIVVVVLGIMRYLQNPSSHEEAAPSEEAPAEVEQAAWCPEVEVLAAPGTWESSPEDDPYNPTFNPNSLMLTITRPLQETYGIDSTSVPVWTLPYTAQFRNINALNEMSYDDSRNEGTATFTAELERVHAQCPESDFILMGFSQGAVIVGDIANQIGTGQSSIPAERVRGVALIADGRREPGVGQFPGTWVNGVGAEVALHSVSTLVQPIVPGATMRGPREGGFGTLNDRTQDICATDDAICDAPLDILNALDRAQALVAANGVHARYATNPDVIPGTTATAWVEQWARNLIGNP